MRLMREGNIERGLMDYEAINGSLSMNCDRNLIKKPFSRAEEFIKQLL